MNTNKKDKKEAITKKLDDAGRQFSDATLLLHEMVAQKAGLTGADHKYLGILIQHGSMTAGTLASMTGLTTGAVTGVIDRLENKHLVSREKDPVDRRKVLVVPNKSNTFNLLSPIFTRLLESMAPVYQQFSVQEMDIILRYLDSTSKVLRDLITEMKMENKP